MVKNSFRSRGQSLIGIIIVLVVAGLISGGLYYYLSKQIPEVPEITKKSAEEEIIAPEEVIPHSEEKLPKEKVPPSKEEAPPEEVKPETTCQNDCSPAETKKCSNNSYQTCGNYDADNCLEWSSVTVCSLNTICQNGNCIQQKCPDGTLYGQCSLIKPLYCQNGTLINKCSPCGCPSGWCQTDGGCLLPAASSPPTPPPQCASGSCCDTSTNSFRPLTYKCQENVASEYGCPWGNNPGSDAGTKYQNRYCSGSSANCDGTFQWSDWTIYQDCPSNKSCVAGACQLLTCSDGTLYGQCSTNKPKYCANGNLIDSCSACGCASLNEMCQADGACGQKTHEVPILVLKYFPLSGGVLDATTTGMNDDLSTIRAKVNSLTNQTIDLLKEGSKYHGYKNPSAVASLNFTIVDTKEFLEAMPVSSNEIPWSPEVYRPDYNKILSELNICNYVENQGVKEVWIWGYHYGNLEPTESNMAGPLGDTSNSERIVDMPTCSKTYTLYNYNYSRGLGEALENHTHQIEAVLGYIDNDLFWNKFVNPYGETAVANRCGWTHSPPNTKVSYDWRNETDLLSDCEDWKPDETGEAKMVNCHTWYEGSCLDDSGAKFKIWWMQNIPGKNNNLSYQGKKLRNWWNFVGDFDQAVQEGKSLAY